MTLRVRAAVQAIRRGEACGVAAGFDVGEGLGDSVKAERVELIEGRMREQGVIS